MRTKGEEDWELEKKTLKVKRTDDKRVQNETLKNEKNKIENERRKQMNLREERK